MCSAAATPLESNRRAGSALSGWYRANALHFISFPLLDTCLRFLLKKINKVNDYIFSIIGNSLQNLSSCWHYWLKSYEQSLCVSQFFFLNLMSSFGRHLVKYNHLWVWYIVIDFIFCRYCFDIQINFLKWNERNIKWKKYWNSTTASEMK